jgi:hypothetical protein
MPTAEQLMLIVLLEVLQGLDVDRFSPQCAFALLSSFSLLSSELSRKLLT